MPRVSWDRLESIITQMHPSNQQSLQNMRRYEQELLKQNPHLLGYLDIKSSSAYSKVLAQTMYYWGIGLLVLMGMNEEGATAVPLEKITSIQGQYRLDLTEEFVHKVADFMKDLEIKEPVVYNVLKSYFNKAQGWRGIKLSERDHWEVLSVCLVLVASVFEAWQEEV